MPGPYPLPQTSPCCGLNLLPPQDLCPCYSFTLPRQPSQDEHTPFRVLTLLHLPPSTHHLDLRTSHYHTHLFAFHLSSKMSASGQARRSRDFVLFISASWAPRTLRLGYHRCWISVRWSQGKEQFQWNCAKWRPASAFHWRGQCHRISCAVSSEQHVQGSHR